MFKQVLLGKQQGIVAPTLLLLIAVVGILGFFMVVSLSPLKNTLFSAIYPKQASHAAGIVDLSLAPDAVAVSVGKTFLVDVVIDAKTQQPSAAEVVIKYNPAVLQALDVEQGSFFTTDLSQSAQNPVISNGMVHFTYGQQPNQLKTGAGSIATIQFKALATSASSAVTIDSNNTQVAAIGQTGNVAGNLSNSTVTVTAASTVTKTAEFSLSPSSGNVSVGAEIPVVVKVKSATDNANLFSAKLNFDPAKLEVSHIDTAGSFITQWVSGTDAFDNVAGRVSVIGGVQNPGHKTGTTPETMATVYFKGKGPGTAAVSFDGSSVIFRNSDNADILLTATPGSYNVTGVAASPTPTPVASSTPTPSSSTTPSTTPSATPNPSASAIPSTSPIASASAPGTGTCTITNASWITSANPIAEKKLVNLKAVATGNCAGKTVSFTVLEDDGLFSNNDPVLSKPTSPVKFSSNNEAISSWLTEFQNDGFNGINNPPEYFFTAGITGGLSAVISANPELKVTPLTPGQIVKGDANRDNKIDLADLSILLTNWNVTQNIIDDLDSNDDGVINTFDFAYMVQLLKLQGVIQ